MMSFNYRHWLSRSCIFFKHKSAVLFNKENDNVFQQCVGGSIIHLVLFTHSASQRSLTDSGAKKDWLLIKELE